MGKRAFDIAFSLGVIAVGFVPGLLLSIAIAIDTKAGPIYSQERVGRHGKSFRIYKFRTMVSDSDDLEKYFNAEQAKAWERERKVKDDPRVTRLGRALRATSIDEMPQFANVLVGDMSVIGPRAITPDELERCYSEEEREILLGVTPGITGAWQSGPRNDATYENGQRQRIELSYAATANLGQDIRIFFKTFLAMFVRRTGR